MREQKQVEIDGYTYLINQFGARKGIKLGKKVSKVILPAISKIYGSEETEMNLGAVLEAIADHIDELDDHTIEELLSETTVNKYQIDFDSHFAGRYSALFKLLWEVVEFNFQDVFSQVVGDTGE